MEETQKITEASINSGLVSCDFSLLDKCSLNVGVWFLFFLNKSLQYFYTGVVFTLEERYGRANVMLTTRLVPDIGQQ